MKLKKRGPQVEDEAERTIQKSVTLKTKNIFLAVEIKRSNPEKYRSFSKVLDEAILELAKKEGIKNG